MTSQYVCAKRFKGKALCGEVNIPYGTKVDVCDSLILHKGKPVCYTTSQNAYDFFACNDDGNGLDRGKLTQEIVKTLSRRDKAYQDRWDMVWEDALCQKYKREDDDEYWLWNHAFFNAPIYDLNYIKSLIAL